MGRIFLLLAILTASSAQNDCDSLRSQSTYQAAGRASGVLKSSLKYPAIFTKSSKQHPRVAKRTRWAGLSPIF